MDVRHVGFLKIRNFKASKVERISVHNCDKFCDMAISDESEQPSFCFR